MEPTYEGLKPVLKVFREEGGISLEPTYEGLKPRNGARALCAWTCLEPTYEGLKPCPQTTQRREDGRLEPTYEGLKPRLGIPAWTIGSVWSLPMRD